MSRVFVTIAVVLAVAGMLLVGCDILEFRLGLPSVSDLLFLLWPNVASGLGAAASEYVGWGIIIITGLVTAFLVARFPKYTKY